MAKGSFRAVPGEVRRFVGFVGADLPTGRLDRHQWRSWVRHLKIEVEEGRLAVKTARVISSRARALVRWLVANRRAQAVPDFAASGRKVMGQGEAVGAARSRVAEISHAGDRAASALDPSPA
jgi:hypothetical protein